MLTLDHLDRCRRSIDETQLALYQLTKALREDIALIEKDIEWNKSMNMNIIALEMEKKRNQMTEKLSDYEHLKECCEKAIGHIKDSERWAMAMK